MIHETTCDDLRKLIERHLADMKWIVRSPPKSNSRIRGRDEHRATRFGNPLQLIQELSWIPQVFDELKRNRDVKRFISGESVGIGTYESDIPARVMSHTICNCAGVPVDTDDAISILRKQTAAMPCATANVDYGLPGYETPGVLIGKVVTGKDNAGLALLRREHSLSSVGELARSYTIHGGNTCSLSDYRRNASSYRNERPF
jgi:hypothetical protein